MYHTAEITIFGAGVMGLSLALELHRRGHTVQLREQGMPGMQASWAAAGMLAANDPYNPAALAPFAIFSAGLYPEFLHQLGLATGLSVPFQTDVTMQSMPDGTVQRLAEHSIDPRQLVTALVTAVQRARIPVLPPLAAETHLGGVVVHTTGAWAGHAGVRPRKGQMLRVQLPSPQPLTEVYRSEHVYLVPRTAGAQAGTVLLGATLEDCGFNTDVRAGDLAQLRARAAELVPHLPALGDASVCPVVEAWAGLRPCTADDLPLLGDLPAGEHGERILVATGHFRNGILLAPGTAAVIADLIEGRQPQITLAAFDPLRTIVPHMQSAT